MATIAEVKANHTLTPMPQYQSHKKVWALKIRAIEFPSPKDTDPDLDAGAIIIPDELGFAPFIVSKEYVTKHKPIAGGYFVQYEDGYKSWSPAASFEQGYKRYDALDELAKQQRQDEKDILPILPMFAFHPLHAGGRDRCREVAQLFSNLLRDLDQLCPPGREFSIVRTKLEEAAMFANKSIAVDPRYQLASPKSLP